MFVKAQEQITCFSDISCTSGSSTGRASESDCCNHGVAPFGVAFTIDMVGGCQPCPTGIANNNIIYKCLNSILQNCMLLNSHMSFFPT